MRETNVMIAFAIVFVGLLIVFLGALYLPHSRSPKKKLPSVDRRET